MALRFDSDAERASRIEAFAYNAAYTALGWARLSADPDRFQHLVAISRGTDGVYEGNAEWIGTTSDGTTARIVVRAASAGGTSTPLTVAVGTWYKCAMVRVSATELRVYFEPAGTPITAPVATDTTDVSSRAAAQGVYLGGYNGLCWNGRTAGWRFWQGAAFTPEQIEAEFASATPVGASPWAALPVDGATVAALLTDQTANLRNFTEVGTLAVEAGPTLEAGDPPPSTSMPPPRRRFPLRRLLHH